MINDIENVNGWQPNKKTDEILSKAMESINSVSYSVSLRWVFYRLLQQGYYSKKGDYVNWVQLSSKARHALYGNWKPDTLTDDSRERIKKTGGSENIVEGLKDLKKGVYANLSLDHFYNQNYYVEIWFEARAMVRQFEHYTNHINLFPFGGQTSIPMKWETAKELENYKRQYGKDIVVLYFGDYDKAGLQIPESAVKDIREWCKVDFEFIRCGLTEEQAIKYDIPENPDKPDEYQWEALPDAAAGQIIKENLCTYIDPDLSQELAEKAWTIKNKLNHKINVSLRQIVDEILSENE